MSDFGVLIDDNTVQFRRLLPGPIDRVWRYLTESEKRATWLAAGDTELRGGGSVELKFHNAGLSPQPDDPPPAKYKDLPEFMTFTGEVTRCEPPRLVSHTWLGDDEISEVTYELHGQGDQVVMTLTHTRLVSRSMLTSVCSGWHTHLDILAEVMGDMEPGPFWRRHTVLEAAYEERLPKT
jgi:uncharacterized protein YndB with AHSA1/START domain